MMAPIQISLFWYTYYYFTAWIRWAVKTGELWLSVTRTTGHWSTTEMLRVGGFLVLAGPTTYGRLKTMEASSKWNQIVSTKTHQGKKFRNLIHIRFILVMNSKSNTVRAECTHMERGSRLLTSDRLLVLCFSLWLSSGSDLYPASMSTKRKHRVNPKHVTWTMEHLSHK